MKNELIGYTVILGIIACVAAIILGYTNKITAAPIKEAQRMDFLAGLNAVLPAFDNKPDEDSLTVDNTTVYIAKSGGNVVGYAAEAVSRKGYGGNITVIVGVGPQNRIIGIKVLRHTETPGLGDKISSASFTDQFKGGDIFTNYAVKADQGIIDQFSGATISPRAVCEAVNIANAVLARATQGSEQ